MDFVSASFEVQFQELSPRRAYPVRVAPLPRTWYLQPQTHKYRPYLRYWAMATFPDSNHPEGHSTWTLWFTFHEPPLEHLDRLQHHGMVTLWAEKGGPHQLMMPGFSFDLFVGVGGTIARGEILDSHVTA